MEQENQIFRKKSLERIASPEKLNDYLKVTNVSAWLVLCVVIVLLIGFAVWSAVGNIETRVSAEARAQDGVVTIVLPSSSNGVQLEAGMEVEIGKARGEISTVRTDDYGRSIASADIDIPDGTYGAEIVVERISPLSFLF